MATYVSESARYTMLLGKFEENHAKEKQKARVQLKMALASIQTELEFFDSDWEDQWDRVGAKDERDGA